MIYIIALAVVMVLIVIWLMRMEGMTKTTSWTDKFLSYIPWFKPEECKGVPKQFLYKTLKGSVSVAYLGHLCRRDRNRILGLIHNYVDIIIGQIPDSPVKCVSPACLVKRGWLKLSQLGIPTTTYQAADIERTALRMVRADNVKAISIQSQAAQNTAPLSCGELFAQSGCSSIKAQTQCPDICGSYGQQFDATGSSQQQCTLAEGEESPWLF